MAPVLAQRALDAGAVSQGELSLALQAQLSPGWRAAEANGVDFKPVFVNPSVQVNQRYVGEVSTALAAGNATDHQVD